MKTTRKKINDYLFFFLLIFIAIAGQIEMFVIWHIIILFLFLFIFFCNYKRKGIYSKNILLLFFIISILFANSIFISNNYSALFKNIRSSAYSLCVIGILYEINKYDNIYLCKKIFQNIKFFNVLLLLNIVILALQCKRTGFLIRTSWLAKNSYYEDHCAGLFGFNATNVLGVYSIFVMMLNLSYFTILRRNLKKTRIIILTLFEQGLLALLSQFNDNMGYYLLLVIFLCIYGYTRIRKNKNILKRFLSIAKYIILLILLIIIALNFPIVGNYIQDKVFERIQKVLFWNSFGGASGSSERLAIIVYALTLPSTLRFGTGVGSTYWIQGKSYNFLHFGINSAGSYILIAGLWFYLFYTLFYSEICYSLFADSKQEQSFGMKLIILITIIIFTLYTTLFNDARTCLFIGMIAIVIRPMLGYINYDNIFNNERRKEIQ